MSGWLNELFSNPLVTFLIKWKMYHLFQALCWLLMHVTSFHSYTDPLESLSLFCRWGNWDSETRVNVSRPNSWWQTRCWTQMILISKPGYLLASPKPRVRRKTWEVPTLAHLLCYLKKFRRSSHPCSLIGGGWGTATNTAVLGSSLSWVVVGVWLPRGPQCHFGNRLLTEDAHGHSFL